jgi:hypothetical protein
MRHVVARLRQVNQTVPNPLPLPTSADVGRVEKELEQSLPASLKQLLLAAGDVVFGQYEPITLTLGSGHTYAASVVGAARASGVPRSLFPFCESNGDYFCLLASGQVVYWSHDGASPESWPSLEAWVTDVWLSGDVP